ncbi:hypothetical protein G6F40_017148 [Rhizopus arrhizus]|nr:hypothetical protein G6F40_017148 [Rhizopus arrhizus]
MHCAAGSPAQGAGAATTMALLPPALQSTSCLENCSSHCIELRAATQAAVRRWALRLLRGHDHHPGESEQQQRQQAEHQHQCEFDAGHAALPARAASVHETPP